VKCLDNGLWLCAADDLRYAVLLSAHREHGEEAGVRIEIVAPAGATGTEFVRRSFSDIENAVNAAHCYRGKVLSFDAGANYRGRSQGLMVHKLPPVERANVILPEATLKLLDRNVLARLLQPTMVVIEDVDLIARDREMMGPCEETLLNRLLNEMDGLKEDADILFVLTTNRPEQLEGALANRPGRIDQAIEIPLPDDVSRRKLIQLYGNGLALDEALVSEAAHRTRGVSAAFIKEMMRRTAQASISRNGGTTIRSADLGEALDDMLFASGKLNVKLLGGAQEAQQEMADG
jgi:hypothetical protein